MTRTNRKWNPMSPLLADDCQMVRGLAELADPQVDPRTGTFSVRAEMPNPEHVLLPGQFTKVKLLLDVRENAVVVPSKATVIEKGDASVSSCARTVSWRSVSWKQGPNWATAS